MANLEGSPKNTTETAPATKGTQEVLTAEKHKNNELLRVASMDHQSVEKELEAVQKEMERIKTTIEQEQEGESKLKAWLQSAMEKIGFLSEKKAAHQETLKKLAITAETLTRARIEKAPLMNSESAASVSAQPAPTNQEPAFTAQEQAWFEQGDPSLKTTAPETTPTISAATETPAIVASASPKETQPKAPTEQPAAAKATEAPAVKNTAEKTAPAAKAKETTQLKQEGDTNKTKDTYTKTESNTFGKAAATKKEVQVTTNGSAEQPKKQPEVKTAPKAEQKSNWQEIVNQVIQETQDGEADEGEEEASVQENKITKNYTEEVNVLPKKAEAKKVSAQPVQKETQIKNGVAEAAIQKAKQSKDEVKFQNTPARRELAKMLVKKAQDLKNAKNVGTYLKITAEYQKKEAAIMRKINKEIADETKAEVKQTKANAQEEEQLQQTEAAMPATAEAVIATNQDAAVQAAPEAQADENAQNTADAGNSDASAVDQSSEGSASADAAVSVTAPEAVVAATNTEPVSETAAIDATAEEDAETELMEEVQIAQEFVAENPDDFTVDANTPPETITATNAEDAAEVTSEVDPIAEAATNVVRVRQEDLTEIVDNIPDVADEAQADIDADDEDVMVTEGIDEAEDEDDSAEDAVFDDTDKIDAAAADAPSTLEEIVTPVAAVIDKNVKEMAVPTPPAEISAAVTQAEAKQTKEENTGKLGETLTDQERQKQEDSERYEIQKNIADEMAAKLKRAGLVTLMDSIVTRSLKNAQDITAELQKIRAQNGEQFGWVQKENDFLSKLFKDTEAKTPFSFEDAKKAALNLNNAMVGITQYERLYPDTASENDPKEQAA